MKINPILISDLHARLDRGWGGSDTYLRVPLGADSEEWIGGKPARKLNLFIVSDDDEMEYNFYFNTLGRILLLLEELRG